MKEVIFPCRTPFQLTVTVGDLKDSLNVDFECSHVQYTIQEETTVSALLARSSIAGEWTTSAMTTDVWPRGI